MAALCDLELVLFILSPQVVRVVAVASLQLPSVCFFLAVMGFSCALQIVYLMLPEFSLIRCLSIVMMKTEGCVRKK